MDLQASIGQMTLAVLTASGRVFAAGVGSSGELGHGILRDSFIPVEAKLAWRTATGLWGSETDRDSGAIVSAFVYACGNPPPPKAVPLPTAPPPVPTVRRTRLAVTVVGDRRIRAGGPISYTIVVRNRGRNRATGVRAQLRLPKNLALRVRSATGTLLTPSNRRYQARGRTIHWRLGDIAARTTKTIVVRMVSAPRARGWLTSRVTVTGANSSERAASPRTLVWR